MRYALSLFFTLLLSPYLYAREGNTIQPKTTAQEPSQLEAKFLYDLALSTYPPDDKPKDEDKVDFDGGCLYDLDVPHMKINLDFCESYVGRLNSPLHLRLSNILLKYQALYVHREPGHRYASAKYTCLRYKKDGTKYFCSFDGDKTE